MDKKVVYIAYTKGFISRDNLIEPSKDYFYLWLCELQKWLRDEKEINMMIEIYTNEDETGFEYEYINYSDRVSDEIDHCDGPFDTYEGALEAACYNALLLLEDK